MGVAKSLNMVLFGLFAPVKFRFSFGSNQTRWKYSVAFAKIAIDQFLYQCYNVKLITAHGGFSGKKFRW